MKYEFSNKHLQALYSKGHDSKYKFFDKGLAKKYVDRINRIESAVTINDLREPPSMEFEKMQGHENRFSIRINDKYRLEFEINFTDENKLTGDVIVSDVTKHYK
ncbi:MAG: type II toxin-antitoxin system RelE/ParE family toxin [Kiritimatiellae bacterium]|nr:type II toxin-antitoxin system RelE/ParE family toxin [Kiritimatiellia bacterium]MDD5519463.1 type II toxin-antitoxin system RelE/ParE family toxin [Kiritimatiellia bacterium]